MEMSDNMKKIMGMILGLALLSGAFFKVNIYASEEPLVRSMTDYMYTSITVTLYNATIEDLNEIEKIYQEYTIISNNFNFKDDDFDGVNDYLSNPFYGQTSIYDVNQKAFDEPVVVSQKLFDLLLEAKALYLETNGFFDVSIGRAVDLIKQGITSFGYDEMPKADFDQLMNDIDALGRVTFSEVILDETNLTVQFTNENVKLDLGALAKGYATQKAVDYLEEQGITTYMINAGSSNIAVGKHPENRDWRLGLRHPVNPMLGLYAVVSNTDKAIVTSGNFEQFFTYDEIRYHHIISPKDYLPKQFYHAVTLIGDDSGHLDGLSTAIFNMPFDEAKAVVENLGIEAIFFMYDGKINTMLDDTEVELRVEEETGSKPNDVEAIAYILGGVVIVGGIIIVLLSINEKKKGANYDKEKEE
jgi:thiamine biosynthesis lipoprotein